MKRELVAVVLAGGAGSRFWPLTTNKIVFPFLGKSLFDFSVRDVLPKEVTRAVIVAGRDNRDVLSTVRLRVPSVTVLQQKPLGMADALLAAGSQIAGSELLILIADDLADSGRIQQVVALGRASGAFGVIPGWKTGNYFPGGYLKTEGRRIVGIAEKPGEGKTPSPYVAISGHYVRSGDMLLRELARTHTTGRDDVYERALTAIAQHEEFVIAPYEGTFVSLKYAWHVLDGMEYLLSHVASHRGKGVKISDHVVIEGNVYLDDGVTILENTKIVGPCYIGRDTIVGNNNLIRLSHIGSNCVTGFSTDITRSYIGDRCWFHSNYIGDSVLESAVTMGSGAVLANLRLDDGEIVTHEGDQKIATGRNKLGGIIATGVRIGVNTSIMPGVKIGQGCFIGAGMVVSRDLPEQTYCQQKTEYTLAKNSQASDLPSRENFRKALS